MMLAEKSYEIMSRMVLWGIGSLWGYLEPTIPFMGICFFAVLLDCCAAYRLALRVRKNHPDAKVHDKFESAKASKVFGTIFQISSVIVLLWMMDEYIFPFSKLYLANWAAGGFCAIQVWSILENESSENGAAWAKALQTIMINKASRHLEDAAAVLETLNNTHNNEDSNYQVG